MTDLERMVELRASGMGYREIARHTGETYSRVYRALNPGYTVRQNEKRRTGRDSLRSLEIESLRDEVRRLRDELELERARTAAAKPMRLTELHEWWLATKSPEEIVRIASGLSGWEQEAA